MDKVVRMASERKRDLLDGTEPQVDEACKREAQKAREQFVDSCARALAVLYVIGQVAEEMNDGQERAPEGSVIHELEEVKEGWMRAMHDVNIGMENLILGLEVATGDAPPSDKEEGASEDEQA